MEEILLVGGGGHCLSCIDVIEADGEYRIVGIIDPRRPIGELVAGYPVVGVDADIARLLPASRAAFICVGQIKSASPRRSLADALRAVGARLPAIRSPRAAVARTARVGDGSIIHHFACLNSEASIGVCCIVNTGAIVEHEAKVGSFCHIATGAVVNGGCSLGDDVFVGSRAALHQGVAVAAGTVIAAGSVVRRDIAEAGVYAGNPAERIS